MSGLIRCHGAGFSVSDPIENPFARRLEAAPLHSWRRFLEPDPDRRLRSDRGVAMAKASPGSLPGDLRRYAFNRSDNPNQRRKR